LHLRPGDVFLGSNQRYQIVTPHGARWLSAGLRATTFTTFDLLQALQPPQVWRPDENARALLETLLRALVETWFGRPDYPTLHPGNLGTDELIARGHDASANLICRSLGGAIVGHCWQMHRAAGAEVSPAANAPAWLVGALRRFHDDPTADVAHVARDVGLSPAQFRRSFRQWTGSAPRDHLQQERLRAAQRLLENTDASVAAIAHSVGFKSCSHFIRLWQRHYGHSPAQHRIASREAKV
jgi:AraC-like DNA-binding protein